MPITLPVYVTFAFLLSSLIAGWDHPLHVERVELRVGHAIANNSDAQPSGFQLTDALPSLTVPLSRPFGPSWARGRIAWNPELQFGLFSAPYVRPLFGFRPLQFRYEVEPVPRWSLYSVAGVGGIYANIERQETGSDGNFSLILGAGVRYAATQHTSWILEYRHSHISNNGIDRQNSGIDSHCVLFGISVRL